MRIYLNREPVEGPWGGGNHLVRALASELAARGHDVTYSLAGPDVAALVCFDPRPNARGEDALTFASARRARPDLRLVCRVGDTGSHGKPEIARLWSALLPLADCVVFPSRWAQERIAALTEEAAADAWLRVEPRCSVVPNAPCSVFYEQRRPAGPPREPLRVVTHHWSDNPRKGYELYAALDALDICELTFIGRAPPGFELRNARGPLPADALARELPEHDVYLTASLEEAGANHVLEALACGLPVVHSDGGGSIPEYCAGAGPVYEGWSLESLRAALDRVVRQYAGFQAAALTYRSTVEGAAARYADLITGAAA